MYEVQRLTRPEKVLISNTFYPAGIALEHAWYMLEGALDLFGSAPHTLRDDEAERLRFLEGGRTGWPALRR
jgi:hypothetical protein